jgi:hypothetical protein
MVVMIAALLVAVAAIFIGAEQVAFLFQDLRPGGAGP